jgi:hypothetical protein
MEGMVSKELVTFGCLYGMGGLQIGRRGLDSMASIQTVGGDTLAMDIPQFGGTRFDLWYIDDTGQGGTKNWGETGQQKRMNGCWRLIWTT